MKVELTKDCKPNQELELPWRPGMPKVASDRKACRIIEVQSDSQLVETLATAVIEESAGQRRWARLSNGLQEWRADRSRLQVTDEMNSDEGHDTPVYKVVVNHEEQYSIWPADRDIPLGWSDAGKSGPKAECLAYVKEVWIDLRPLSLRRKMAKDASSSVSHNSRSRNTFSEFRRDTVKE